MYMRYIILNMIIIFGAIFIYGSDIYAPFSNELPCDRQIKIRYNYNHGVVRYNSSNNYISGNSNGGNIGYTPIRYSSNNSYYNSGGGSSNNIVISYNINRGNNNSISVPFNNSGNINISNNNYTNKSSGNNRTAGDVYVYTVVADDGTVFTVEWRHGTINIFGTKFEVGNVYVIDDDGLDLNGSYLSESLFKNAVDSALAKYNLEHPAVSTPIGDGVIIMLILLFIYTIRIMYNGLLLK